MDTEKARSELEKAGAIQAFEICYELSWKTMKRILAYRGLEANSPREVFRLYLVPESKESKKIF